MLKKLYKFSLILNGILILVVILFFYLSSGALQRLAQQYIDGHYERRTSLFELLPHTKNEIIFIGASHTEGANWDEVFQNSKIKNRGISGDKTSGVLERLDKTIEGKPAKIFIQIGYNDLNAEVSIEDIVKNHEQILKKIKKQSSKTQIYLQSLTPVLYKLNGSNVKNEDIMVINSRLEKLTKKHKVTFIDLFSALEGDEQSHELDEKYTNDGLHLNAAGYTRWKALVEQYVNG